VKEWDTYEEAGKVGRLFRKLTRGPQHLYRNIASRLVKTLHKNEVLSHYQILLNIAQDEGNELMVNVWSYSRLLGWITPKAEEYGMKVLKVVEHNTSKHCAYHCVGVKRPPRGSNLSD